MNKGCFERKEGGRRVCASYLKPEGTRGPLVSIITTSLNRKDTIERTIQSVQNQTYLNIEHIVVDGCSSDGTVDVVEKYSEVLDYWVSEPDEGHLYATNKGLGLCRGQLIVLLCSDEYIKEDYVEKIVEASLQNPDCGFFYGEADFIDKQGNFFFRSPGQMFQDGQLLAGCNWVATCKEVYDRIGYFDPSYKIATDSEFILRMRNAKISGKYIPNIVRHMQWGGMSQTKWFRSYFDHARAEVQYGASAWKVYLHFLVISTKTFARNVLERIFGQRRILLFRKLWNEHLTLDI